MLTSKERLIRKVKNEGKRRKTIGTSGHNDRPSIHACQMGKVYHKDVYTVVIHFKEAVPLSILYTSRHTSYHWSCRSKDRRWISKCERRHKIKQTSLFDRCDRYPVCLQNLPASNTNSKELYREEIRSRHIDDARYVLQDGKPRVFRTSEIGRVFYRHRHYL